jgi:predicted translin family RNA/ssDNA-binding protein
MEDSGQEQQQKNKSHGNRRYQQQRSRNTQAKFAGIDESNPILCAFKKYSEELDDKHDRYERIIKHSRDITIESKRIIFSLHSIDSTGDEKKQSETLAEAKERILKICATHFAAIGEELVGRDPYQYSRAYSAGLQEFIEAYTFWEYISGNSISDWNTLQNSLTYETKDSSELVAAEETVQLDVVEKVKHFKCFIQPIEFMLGLADLGGEFGTFIQIENI